MTVLDIVIQGEDNASGAFKSVDASLGNLGKTAGMAVKAGMAVAGTAIVAVGAAAVGAGIAALNLSSDINNATNKIAAQMGISKDAAAGFEDVMKNIYANNFGESFDDIGAAVVTVSQALGEMPDAALQGVAEDAFALRDAFEIDVTQSVTGAKALMEAFGISGEQSMDFIASGMQNGLNASDDFIESIGEYSNLFAEAGFSADEMYNIMDSGAQAGILGTDKIADAIKEMGIILNEAGDDTKEAFDTMGLSFDDIAASVASGDETWADYFDQIVGGLNDIEDPMERSKAQVAIFGTMAEDLGVSFTEGLSAAGKSLKDMTGATEALNAQYDNWPSMWEGIKRQTQLALEPLGDALLKIGNDLMPVVQDAFKWLGEKLPPIIAAMVSAISAAVAFFQTIRDGKAPMDAIRDVLSGFGFDIGTVEGKARGFATMLQSVFGPVVDRIKEAILGLSANMQPLLPLFADLGAAVQRAWVLIKPAMEALGVVAAVVAAVILDLWGNQLAAMFNALPGIIGGVVKVITGIINGLVDLFSGMVKAVKLLLEGDFIGAFEAAGDGLTGWVEGTISALDGLVDIISGLFEIIYDTVVNTINDMTGSTIASFDEMKSSVLSAAEPMLAFFDRVKEFGSWIANKVFSFKIDLPDLPDWAIPGSPLPLHTAWEAFLNFLNSAAFQVNFSLGMNGETVDAEKIANVVIKMAEAIKAIAGSLRPAIEAFKIIESYDIPRSVLDKVEEMLFQINWLVRGFGAYAYELGGSMKDAEKLVNVTEKIANIVVAIIDTLHIIKNATIPQGLGEKYKILVNEAHYFTLLFGEAASTMEKEVFPQIIAYIEAVTSVFGLVELAITSMQFLSNVDFGPILKEGYHLRDQMIIFRNIVRSTMREFNIAASELSGDMSAAVGALAEAAGKVFEIVELVIEKAAFLSDTDFGPILKDGYHLHNQTVILRNIVRDTMRQFAEAADEMTTDGMAAIEDYIDAARAVFGLIEEAMASIALVAGYVGFSDLLPKIEAFRTDLIAVATELINAIGGMDLDDLPTVAQDLSDKIVSVLAVVSPAIEALGGIGEYVALDWATKSISEFTDDFELLVAYLGQSFQNIIDDPFGVLIETSYEFAEKVSAVLNVVKPAVEALGAISQYIALDWATKSISEFMDDFELLVAYLGQSLQNIIDDPFGALIETTYEFASKVATVLGVVGPAIETLGKIGEFVKIENLNAKLTEFTTQLSDAIGGDSGLVARLNEIAGLIGEGEIETASGFAAGIAAILNSVMDAFNSLRDLANSEMPGGLKSILTDMIDVLRSSIPDAALAGYDFGLAWINGVREAIGAFTLDMPGGVGLSGAAAGAATGGGLTTNLNLGGLTFNTTIANGMDEQEFHSRVIETIRSLV